MIFIRLHSDKSRASSVRAILVASAVMITGCASTEKLAETATPVDHVSTEETSVDPYEGFNRSIYGFNMGLDKYFFKPVSDGYKFITPDFMETGVSNFFNNLKGIREPRNTGKIAKKRGFQFNGTTEIRSGVACLPCHRLFLILKSPLMTNSGALCLSTGKSGFNTTGL